MPFLKIMMNRLDLFVEKIKNIKTVGAIDFTSKPAIDMMVAPITANKAKYIVELGGGNGCITESILEELPADGKLLCFEINQKFCQLLREIDDERLIVIEDSAEKLPEYLQSHQIEELDMVVSSLPLSLMPDKVIATIFDGIVGGLKATGMYVQIQYSLITKKMLEKRFTSVEHTLEVRNIPPAFIFICQN